MFRYIYAKYNTKVKLSIILFAASILLSCTSKKSLFIGYLPIFVRGFLSSGANGRSGSQCKGGEIRPSSRRAENPGKGGIYEYLGYGEGLFRRDKALDVGEGHVERLIAAVLLLRIYR